jgi:hypothetical protein
MTTTSPNGYSNASSAIHQVHFEDRFVDSSLMP